MEYYRENIENLTLTNKNYRKVLYTTPNIQLVVMSIQKGDEIHQETHKNTTQFIRVESGKGYIRLGDKKGDKKGDKAGVKTLRLYDGICVIVPPNTKHYLKNSGDEDLKLYSIYSPPEHDINRLDKNNPDKNNPDKHS